MDYSLKERLIGAIVLVTLMVSIVPLFLDGRHEETGSIRSLIPEQQQKQSNRKTIILKLERSNPSPSNEDNKDFYNLERVKSTIELIKSYMSNFDSEDEITVTNTSGDNNDLNDRPWVIQLGSFLLVNNANKKVQLLKSQGYKAYIVENIRNNEKVYNVWLGPQRSKEESDKISLLLVDDEHENQVVPY
ncbi:SPOR domain-containing protein [Woeseiaceae bacterium]|nr:SPOR domain-containing protein [Woeseiaceae bacterium]